MRRLTLILTLLGAALMLVPAGVFAAGHGAGGVTGPAIYVDTKLYRTVGTPTDLSKTGAPAHSFDTIYAFDKLDQPHNVATAAPGDRGYNGGRWMVHPLSFKDDDYHAALAKHDANGSGSFDSFAEIEAALSAGDALDGGVARMFECPVIPLPQGHRT